MYFGACQTVACTLFSDAPEGVPPLIAVAYKQALTPSATMVTALLLAVPYIWSTTVFLLGVGRDGAFAAVWRISPPMPATVSVLA